MRLIAVGTTMQILVVNTNNLMNIWTKTRRFFVLRLLVAFFTSIIAFSFANAADKLIVTGSSTVAPLLSEVAKRFEKNNEGIRVDVQTGGSSRGIADARQGVADIGMVSRALKSSESDLQAYAIAMDGVGIIINSSNPIQELSDDQVVQIFKGQIKSWKEVGGKDRSIVVVNKAEGRSTLELFLHYFQIKPTDINASVVIGDNEQGIKTVAGNPSAIGYVSIGSAEYSVSEGVKIKLLPMNGIEASTKNVMEGKFPLSRPLNLVVKGDVSGVKKKFLDFAQSDKVNDLIKDQYFVSIKR